MSSVAGGPTTGPQALSKAPQVPEALSLAVTKQDASFGYSAYR
jgi:hypothetical protein